MVKINELREKGDEDLIKMLNDLKKDLVNISAEKPQNVKNIKRVIAQIKTILRERGTKI